MWAAWLVRLAGMRGFFERRGRKRNTKNTKRTCLSDGMSPFAGSSRVVRGLIFKFNFAFYFCIYFAFILHLFCIYFVFLMRPLRNLSALCVQKIPLQNFDILQI
jgi:hypothetical protein